MFGMTPFGWRFMSALFGIFMVPLFYLFAKRLFQNTFAATATAILLVFDCMHFMLSRIATIDIFVAFFIILAYYYLYRYFLADQQYRQTSESLTVSERRYYSRNDKQQGPQENKDTLHKSKPCGSKNRSLPESSE